MNVDYQVIRRFMEGQEKEGDKELILDWFSDLTAEKDLKAKYKHFWSELPRSKESKAYDGDIILGRIYHKIKLEEILLPLSAKYCLTKSYSIEKK